MKTLIDTAKLGTAFLIFWAIIALIDAFPALIIPFFAAIFWATHRKA